MQESFVGGSSFFAVLALCILTSFPLVSIASNASQPKIDSYSMVMVDGPQSAAKVTKYQVYNQIPAYAFRGFWPNITDSKSIFCKTRKKRPSGEELSKVVNSELYRFLNTPEAYAVHLWQKYGSCSGLSFSKYNQAALKVFESISLPDEITKNRSAEKTYNLHDLTKYVIEHSPLPSINEESIAVRCVDKKYWSDIRICVSNDLTKAAPCGKYEEIKESAVCPTTLTLMAMPKTSVTKNTGKTKGMTSGDRTEVIEIDDTVSLEERTVEAEGEFSFFEEGCDCEDCEIARNRL